MEEEEEEDKEEELPRGDRAARRFQSKVLAKIVCLEPADLVVRRPQFAGLVDVNLA